jgi:hypothetical protein
VEARDDVGGFEDREPVGADQQRRMVVDQVQDLDLGAVSEPPVGDVGLPALVWHLRFEPDE